MERPLPTAVHDRGLHSAWHRLGWPPTYAGKLWLAIVAAGSLPVVAAVSAWRWWGLESPMGLWLASGLALSTVVGALMARALAAPLRRAVASLPNPVATADLDDAAILAKKVPRLAQQSLLGRAALASISATDELTGLPSRQEAFERLRHALALGSRDHLPVSAALIDIDHLQAINERWGHAAGDRVLMGIGNRLEQLLRGSDWAARWEEDAFLVVMFSDVDGAQTALERVRHDLSVLRVVTDHYDLGCTVTLGASQARTEDRVQDWIERVEAQLTQAKKDGPGGISLDF